LAQGRSVRGRVGGQPYLRTLAHTRSAGGAMGHEHQSEGEDDILAAGSLIALPLRFMNSTAGHLLLFFLLVLDVLIVVASGFLDTHYLLSQTKDCKAYASACTNHSHSRRLGNDGREERHARLRLLASSGGGSSAPVDCSVDPHFGNHGLHDAEVILAYISIGILGVFLIEQMLRVAGSRCRYLAKPLHVLDICVITVSLVLEVLVTHLPLAGLLVLGRVWRFARTGYTTAEGLHDIHKVRPAISSLAHGAIEAVWPRLPEHRWKALASRSRMELDLEMTEVNLAAEIAKTSPAFVLHALARENERLRTPRSAPAVMTDLTDATEAY